jgi:septal ring factor EnvC (AmiA/AmiB activator)
MLWTDEKINAELDKCEQSADVSALISAMRNEYETALAERIEQALDADRLLIGYAARCHQKDQRIAELEKDRLNVAEMLNAVELQRQRLETQLAAALAALATIEQDSLL